jgi:ABC-2 type transport system permease protein
MRHLFGNPSPRPNHIAWPLEHPVMTSLSWSILLLAVFVPLAVRRYRRSSAR